MIVGAAPNNLGVFPQQLSISHLAPQSSHLTPHTSRLRPHTTHLTPRASNLQISPPQTSASHFTHQNPHLTPHMSHRVTLFLRPHISHVRQGSLFVWTDMVTILPGLAMLQEKMFVRGTAKQELTNLVAVIQHSYTMSSFHCRATRS